MYNKNVKKVVIGQNLVELVVVLPFVVLLILGIIQFGLYWRTFQMIESIALDGANVAASTVDDVTTASVNEVVSETHLVVNSRLAEAGVSTLGTLTPVEGTPPNALYQSPASSDPYVSQLVIDCRNPSSSGIIVQLFYNYVPILAGTRIPLPGREPITIIPDFIVVSSSQILQYNTY